MTLAPDVKPRSIYELIEQKLGITVDFRFGELETIGATNAVAARNDPGRAALTMINLSVNTIIVRPLKPATTILGIVLSPSGGSVAMNWQDDLIMPALEWNAIATGANSEIFIMEALIK